MAVLEALLSLSFCRSQLSYEAIYIRGRSSCTFICIGVWGFRNIENIYIYYNDIISENIFSFRVSFPQKRPVPSDHSESPTPKKQRVIDPSMPLQSPSNGHLGSLGRASIGPRNSSISTKLEFDRMSSSLQDSQNGLYPRHNHSHGEPNGTPKPERLQPDGPVAESPKPPRTEPPVCTEQQLANGQHKKKKSKKHKDKEKTKDREREKERDRDREREREGRRERRGGGEERSAEQRKACEISASPDNMKASSGPLKSTGTRCCRDVIWTG